jgi:hypothetical protein
MKVEAWLNADYRLRAPPVVEPPPVDPVDPDPVDPGDVPAGYARLQVLDVGAYKYLLVRVGAAYKRVLMGVADG